MSERICFAIRYGKENRWFERYEAGTCQPVYTCVMKRRKLWDQGSRAYAYYECHRLATGANVAPRVVKVTIRKRPKPAPELKVGDEVLVRCRVREVPDARKIVLVEEARRPQGSIRVEIESIVSKEK